MLTDDRRARRAAEARRIVCTGTLGVICRAAELGLLNLEETMAALKRTSIRLPSVQELERRRQKQRPKRNPGEDMGETEREDR